MNDVSVTELLDKLREDFLDDLPARIDLIENEVMASQNSDAYDELFRMVHSLKGSAGSYNFHIITKIAHDMEDVMLCLMQKKLFNTSSAVDILLQYIDILRDSTASLIETKIAPLDVNDRLEFLRGKYFGDNLNILVVEPSKVYARLIEHSMEQLPVKFTFVQDGLQALENLLLNKYDLLITSLESPRLNGDALTAALRLVNNFNKGIKVILITSRSKGNIANINDFNTILDRHAVVDGGLNKIVKNTIDS